MAEKIIDGLLLSVKGAEIAELAKKKITELKKKTSLKRLRQKIEDRITNSMNYTATFYEPPVSELKKLRQDRLDEIERLSFVATHVERTATYRVTMVDIRSLGIIP